MSKRALPESFPVWQERTNRAPAGEYSAALYCAIIDRLGLEGATLAEMEARIARWEALEARDDMKASLRAAEIAGNRCGKGAPHLQCLACGGTHAVDSYCASCEPTDTGEPWSEGIGSLGEVSAECGCGGPAGHVPNGVLCRKGM